MATTTPNPRLHHLTEYGEIMQNIARTPRRSIITQFRLMIAGQARPTLKTTQRG